MHDRVLYFSRVAPSQWASTIDRLCGSTRRRLSVRVVWGDHERDRGLRDFRAGSSRGLERFLSLCAEKKVEIDLEVGFFSIPGSLPEWVWEVSRTVRVPERLSGLGSDAFSMVECPDPGEPSVWQGFISFLTDVMSMAALYKEEPLRQIRLNFGWLEVLVDSQQEERILEGLAARYGEIAKMNQSYGTSFRSFDTLVAGRALKVLFERRPWLASFDSKWVRRQRLNQLAKDFVDLASDIGLDGSWDLCLDQQSDARKEGDQFVFDPVFLDQVDSVAGPYLPQEKFEENPLKAYRIWESVCHAELGDVPELLPLIQPIPLRGQVSSVFCGRYLTKAGIRSLVAKLRAGGDVYFPFEVPSYNEDLECFELARNWKTAGSLRYCHFESGTIWSPLNPISADNELWGRVSRQVREIHQRIEGSNA